MKREKKSRFMLIRSLDEGEEGLSEAECEKLWQEEVDRRVRRIREGKVQGIRADEVFASAPGRRS